MQHPLTPQPPTMNSISPDSYSYTRLAGCRLKVLCTAERVRDCDEPLTALAAAAAATDDCGAKAGRLVRARARVALQEVGSDHMLYGVDGASSVRRSPPSHPYSLCPPPLSPTARRAFSSFLPG